MNKRDVQKRVLKNGRPLPLYYFEWDEETKTFSSRIGGLVIDFTKVNSCSFDISSRCFVKTGNMCKIDSADDCVLDTEHECILDVGNYCTLDVGTSCTLCVGEACVVISRDNSRFQILDLEPWKKFKTAPQGMKGFSPVED
jgi:hypothetical protein